MKKFRRILQETVEAVVLLTADLTIRFLPRPAVLALARGLGWLTWVVSGRRRRYALANLDLVYGDTVSPQEKRTIGISSFQNMALVLLDLYWFNFNTDKRLSKYLIYDDSFESIFDGRSNIIVTAHFGNWEVVSLACGRRNIPLTSVALPSKSRIGERVLRRLRLKSGSEIVQRDGALRKVIRALRSGRSTALLLDHNTLPEEGGVFVPFFGLAVPVSDVAKLLVQRTEARIVVAWCMPDKRGVYTVRCHPPLDVGEGGIAFDGLTAHITQLIETFIRENPRYWLWSYRRWRYFREQDPEARYPFYAEPYEEYREYCRLIREYRKATDPSEKERCRQRLAAASGTRKRRLRERTAKQG